MARKTSKSNPTRRLLKDDTQLFDESYQAELEKRRNAPVECLGQTFPNDEARRKHFLDLLAEKLKDPEFRKIEGFPIGKDEDILALSDPPYYTACPNPFLTDFVGVRQIASPKAKDDAYHRDPFAVDVSEGKTDALYKAHSYHTKVPHLAIVPSILHYTEPGDLVLDGFAGSGMTGVAAQFCGAAPVEYRQKLEQQWKYSATPPPRPPLLKDVGKKIFSSDETSQPQNGNAIRKSASAESKQHSWATACLLCRLVRRCVQWLQGRSPVKSTTDSVMENMVFPRRFFPTSGQATAPFVQERETRQ